MHYRPIGCFNSHEEYDKYNKEVERIDRMKHAQQQIAEVMELLKQDALEQAFEELLND